jgi:hypothetical protein
MAQILDPLFVALLNGRAYAALQTARRNAGNTSYEWATAGWLDAAQVWAQTQTFSVSGQGSFTSKYLAACSTLALS